MMSAFFINQDFILFLFRYLPMARSITYSMEMKCMKSYKNEKQQYYYAQGMLLKPTME